MADQIIIQSSEAQVRSVVEAWAKAMRAKDADGVVAHWADDLVQFDILLRRCEPSAMIPRD